MNSIFIILSHYSSGGEALFVGAISGLAIWGITSLIERIRNRKNK